MLSAVQKTSFTAGPLTFAVKHELWDGNIQDHPDQGVAITVAANLAGKQTIRNWMRRADRYEGRCQDGLTTEERQELQKLRRENKRLRESQIALGMVRRHALGLPAHDPALFRRR